MDLPLEQPPLPVVPATQAPPPELPTVTYFLIFVGLYAVLGSVAQACFLPLGIWWSQSRALHPPDGAAVARLGLSAPAASCASIGCRRRRNWLPMLAICVAVFFSRERA